jgi:ATP-dependent helicase STH1/SNF2
MKAQGVRQDDPEYIKLHNQLDAVARHSRLQQQQRMWQQQSQQQQQSHPHAGGEVAHANTNGTHSSTPGPSLMNLNGTSDVDASQTDGSSMGPPTRLFTDEQNQMLRSQLAAYRMLSKNAPIPIEIQRIIFASQRAKKSPTAAEAIAAASAVIDEVANTNKDQEETTSKERNIRTDVMRQMSEPQALRDPILFTKHNSRSNRFLTPGIVPGGIDVDVAREYRENVIHNRLMARKAELEKLSASIGSWDTSKSDTPVDDGSMKLRALIEYKMLNLLPKQRALRAQIGREMVTADTLAMTANRAIYRRIKKQDIREARFTEKLEKDARSARETKEKNKHTDFLKSVQAHVDEVHRAAREQRQRLQKFGRMMVQQHQNIEKEEQKRVERTAKQRLQALKANDEETYLKLLGQAKDSRISHLLKQTDGFLSQLAASVKHTQRSAAERYGRSVIQNQQAEEPEPEAEEEEDEEGGGKKIDYYEVAHRIKESVTKQSEILVGGQLKEYQVKGLQWMISLYNNNLNGILADEMGLGKTIQTISLICYLVKEKRQPGPYLVIVPLSTLTNWIGEFEKWAPSLRKIIYKGPPNQRKMATNQIRSGQFEVLLTTYEFIIKDRPLLSKVKWMHMIVDEGHRMKNAGSKLSITISQYYSTRFRVILTGTPLQNNLAELWAMLNFVLPTIFKSGKSFDEWFNTPFAGTGTQDKIDLTEEEQLLVIRRLHKVLRPFLLRRLKKDVEKDLPDKQERVIKCSFSALQAKLYKQLVTHNRLMVSDGKGGKTGLRGLSNMLMQLRKLCNHPFVFEEVEDQVNPQRITNDLIWRSAGKFELLDRVLPKFQATGHRVLMFFQMTQIMNIMEDYMRLRGTKYMRLDGSTKSEERSDLLKEFNAPNSPYFIFLLSTRAGGLGLNLQTADTVIIFDSDWNPHQDLQAQDRAHRIGQKNEVRILRLISSNSVEEKILERAQYKLDMDGKVIQAGKFDNKSTETERDAMLRVMLETAETAEELEQEEMDDDELNMLMMRSEGELEVFQRIDAERAKDPNYGTNKKYPRLMGESELPDIYLQEDDPDAAVEAIEEIAGRGARERTRVKYDDGLTEEQWLEAVDNDEDTIEAAIARKEARKDRRGKTTEDRIRAEEGLGESPARSLRDSSESPAPTTSKKRSRKPPGGNKRKADDASLDGDSIAATPVAAPSRKRGRAAKVAETLAPAARDAAQDILNLVFEAINNLEETAADPSLEPRPIIDPFIKLPDRKLYPDYYQFIKKPISIEQIEKAINNKQYQGLDEFFADVKLLCDNCRTYNEDGSILYQDANLIEVSAAEICAINKANMIN